MAGKIKRLLFAFFLKPRPTSQYVKFANYYFKLRGSPVRIKPTHPSVFLIESKATADQSVPQIAISEKTRASMYKDGIAKRLGTLAEEYLLHEIDFEPGDTILDCGANIGELGLYFKREHPEIDYAAFEPAPAEFNCCKLNNPSASCINLALWREKGTLDFYLKTDTADSSLIEMNDFERKEQIEADTLDSQVQRLGIEHIKLLKLEAEGAEPEILEGAVSTIPDIEYIAVDAGPERGVEQSSTLPEVVNFLCDRGFEMVQIHPRRLTALFRNRSAR